MHVPINCFLGISYYLQHWCISKHYPNQGIDASGPLKVRTPFGGSVYFNNPNSNYATGTFVVNGRGKLYGDIVGCSPHEPDLRYAPIDCELGTSGQLDCQVQGKFCYYDRDMLTCDARGLYPGSSGYGLILGSNGLNLTPVQLAAQPQPSEP
ncbi:hypothetical protein FOQG_12474 [Fusarium oxysporum f. sp. raphani 54005]|uniref:Uncharacterized protein n=2 Tax=Fusarium oxysporum TaxID=5507 RepID=X0BXQ8_FUSOX|nr:hypothetical protein FOVG_14586 [Fusarium oxysporum f. sp. pisi HDV247]EXK83294.1 hypothetical protein FOQG_12474 [Fusarium oxysporum f. sp. raphani 54005]WKT48116.1 hypothetical protein QSH57_013021 [Fusarium oxysporum f. sp. vasinfectum]